MSELLSFKDFLKQECDVTDKQADEYDELYQKLKDNGELQNPELLMAMRLRKLYFEYGIQWGRDNKLWHH